MTRTNEVTGTGQAAAAGRTAPQRVGKSQRDGFTLLELLTVIFITSVMISMLASRVSIDGYRVDTETQQVSTLMMAAQRMALSKQHNIVVAFDTANLRFRIHRDADNDGTMDTGEVVEYTTLAKTVLFGRGTATARTGGANSKVNFVRSQGGLPAVTFNRSGSASEFGMFYLTSVREVNTSAHPEDSRAVEVDRATGRMSWYRYTTAGWQKGF